ncbi:MAG: MerR family transcriptional regulator [Oscillospiraceae bacterium]|jgi:DNA-binding transcriptional MerR regulator/effector-binding domain-containing protein|nr:MerR family transcriptional regulator [Oscillospiraceae bacterium]
MKEFLTVKEFSRLSGIEQTTLRYWDDIGLFMPAKRDPENNYRYYTPDQIIAVNFISVMSSLDIPLKTIGRIGDKRTPATIKRLIERHEKKLDMEMRRLRECYSIIHSRLELINYGATVLGGFQMIDGMRQVDDVEEDNAEWADVGTISVLYREERPIILGPPNEFVDGEPFYEPFTRFCRMAEEMRINLNYPIGACHENIENFIKSPGRPDYFFSMDPTGNRKRPAGKYLIGFSIGYYGELDNVAERMAAHVAENSLSVTGPVYVIYLHDEICVKDRSQYLAQVCVAIAPQQKGKKS